MITEAARDLESPVIVDVGCGMSSWALERAGIVKGVKIGIDTDPDAQSNKDVDRVILSSADTIPLPDETADIMISSYVLEHIPDPEKAFGEFARILKPGGKLILWTPNKYNYAIALSALTPCRFHNWVRHLACPTVEKDNCETFYRANTARRLTRCIRGAGLELSGPIRYGAGAYQYWAFCTGLLAIAALGSRIVSATPLRCLKSIIIAQAVKPA